MALLQIVTIGRKDTFLLYDENKKVFLGNLKEDIDVLCPCGQKTKIKRSPTDGYLFIEFHEKQDDESPYCCSGEKIEDFQNGAFLIFSA